MISANEARKIAEANNTTKNVCTAVEKVIPTLDKEIRRASTMGGTGVLVKSGIITAATGYYWTKKTVMNAVKAELESYGFRVSICESYTSMRIMWGKV